LAICSIASIGAIASITWIVVDRLPNQVVTTLPLGIAAGLVALLWSYSTAQRDARRAEIVRSFAGLTAQHAGHAIALEDAPYRGDFATRREAVDAALELGGWAIVVRAYERYYVLVGREVNGTSRPVTFRTRAVADVVPALRSA
jgi:hypothetical protein